MEELKNHVEMALKFLIQQLQNQTQQLQAQTAQLQAETADRLAEGNGPSSSSRPFFQKKDIRSQGQLSKRTQMHQTGHSSVLNGPVMSRGQK